MYPENTLAPQNHLADQAAEGADRMIRSTQQAAHKGLDNLAGSVQDLHQQAAPMLDRVADRASALTQRGSEALREGSQQLRERAQRASDSTVNYIKDEPVKAVLFAAAAGALLTLLLRAFGASRQDR